MEDELSNLQENKSEFSFCLSTNWAIFSFIIFFDLQGDLMDNNGFINHGMDNLMETRAGRLGGGGKAVSQLSVTSRAYLQNGGVSYRHEAPMLNDKYFPKVVKIRYMKYTHITTCYIPSL